MPRTTRLGAIWLFGMGLFIAGVAVYGIVSSRWACDVPDQYSGYRLACDLAWVFGAVALAAAGLHALVAISIWRGRLRGVLAGIVLSLLGLWACLGFLEDERWWVVPPVAAGYLGTLLILTHAHVAGWRKRASS